MGRDQDHAKGNLDNYATITRTTEAQGTMVDPVTGTITDADNGVSVISFDNDSMIQCAEQFYTYNMGYDLPWTTIYSENNHKDKIALYRNLAPGYRGRIMSVGTMAVYYRFKGLGYDIKNDYPMMYEAAQKVKETIKDSVYTGTYIETLHNYDFDFWIALPEEAADSEPDAARAKAALAVSMPEYTATASNIIELEDRVIDFSNSGVKKETDKDGTSYASMPLADKSATMVIYNADMPKNKVGLRVRTDGIAKLSLYGKIA